MSINGQKPNAAAAIHKFLDTYPGARSSYIWTAPDIPADVLNHHQKEYLHVASGERPLVILNKRYWFQVLGLGFNGLTITDRAVHFCAVEKSLLASIIPTKKKGAVDWSRIESIEIAEADAAFGTAYVGHELKINGAVAGFVRMGGGSVMDDDTLSYLNTLFGFLAVEKVIERAPKDYTWQ